MVLTFEMQLCLAGGGGGDRRRDEEPQGDDVVGTAGEAATVGSATLGGGPTAAGSRVAAMDRRHQEGGAILAGLQPMVKAKPASDFETCYTTYCHDAVTKVDHRYFQSFIDFGKVTSGEENELDATAPEIGNTLCPNLEADSWMRFQFHELDFGGGGPCAFYPSNLPVEGLFIFLPSCQEGGGVDVVILITIPTPSKPNSTSSLPILVPLTIFDKAAIDLHVVVLCAFRPPMPSNEVMKEALYKVLLYFPHLAGRFTVDSQGRTCIALNNADIRVTETYLHTSISENLPLEPPKEAIHDAVANIDHKYFQSFIDFGEKACQFEEELEATSQLEIGNTMCPNLEVDSWMRFQFHELDFGGGSPCAFYPPNIPVEGLLIFMPSCQEGGGVDVVMSLLPRHVQLN
ncbi:hypothetical protein Scep_012919 [Stephania cephalantha]|uniref:Uncharacterized protein n=1 Tax=Stephania cephalantha TaxID=152367 RepID=A0AAP0PAA1_9MAGN